MRGYSAVSVVLILIGVQLSALSAEVADNRAVLAQIKQIAKEESPSYERLLARAWPMAQQAYKGKEWGGIEEALKSVGLKPAVVSGSGPYTEYRCVVATNACAVKGGSQMNLYLAFGVSGGRSQPTYTVPPDYIVQEVSVGLSVALLARQDEVRKEEWFGKGTVIQEALSAWPVTDAQPVFPLLDTVDISFGEISDAVAEHGSQGYRLQLVLVKGRDDRQSRRQLQCSVAVLRDGKEGRSPVRGWLSKGVISILRIDIGENGLLSSNCNCVRWL